MTSHRSIQLFVSTLCLSLSQWALAATIHFNPETTTGLSIGDRFTIEIAGRNFINGSGNAGSGGGGLDLRWNPAVLAIGDLATDVELLFPGDRFGEDKGFLDSAAGLLRDLSVISFTPATTASFVIAKITFTTLAAGTSLLSLETGTIPGVGLDDWTTVDGVRLTDLQYETATASVAAAVPVPAALFLLPSALSWLAFRTRVRSEGNSASC